MARTDERHFIAFKTLPHIHNPLLAFCWQNRNKCIQIIYHIYSILPVEVERILGNSKVFISNTYISIHNTIPEI